MEHGVILLEEATVKKRIWGEKKKGFTGEF
jgi:hypothetical protein